MARQIVVLFLVFFAIVGLASAAVDSQSASAPAPAEALDEGTDSNVIGTTDGGYNSEAAPVGGPVPVGAFPNVSPAESPNSSATIAGITSAASVVAVAAVAGSFFL